MTKHNDQERALFEAWFTKEIEPSVSYGNPDILRRSYWTAWQARAQLPTPGGEVPDGWKLVPVEPTQEMLFACEDAGSIQNHQRGKRIYRAMLAAAPHPVSVEQSGCLTVWEGAMQESNGKTNYTAILHKGDITEGMTIARSEYPDRVRYEADEVRWLIGERAERPDILDYEADKHSGYAPPSPPAAQDVSGLVEALQAIYDEDPQWPEDIGEGRKRCIYRIRKIAQDALRAHRAQAQGGDT